MQQYAASMMAMQQQQASPAAMRQYYPPQYYVQGGPVSAVRCPLFFFFFFFASVVGWRRRSLSAVVWPRVPGCVVLHVTSRAHLQVAPGYEGQAAMYMMAPNGQPMLMYNGAQVRPRVGAICRRCADLQRACVAA